MRRLIILLSIIFYCNSPLFAQQSDCCNREAILYCDYNHEFMSNTEREKTENEFSAAVFTKFSEIFNRNCFQVILPLPLDASNMPQNEYEIEVKFTQVTNLTKWPNTSIVATLYFDAEGFREQVYTWEVEEPGDSLTVDKISWPSFLDKLANKIESGPEITEIVEKFEKRPVMLEVGCDKEEFDPGEVISVFLTGFKGKFGQTSREFNRIVVHLSAGEITNETACDLGPDYYAFKVERNLIELKYRAPEDCSNPSVKFTIYNSCNVLSEEKQMLNATQKKDLIIEKDFALNCYDAKVHLKKTYHKILSTSYSDSEGSHKHNLNESTEASATVYLTLLESQDMPILDQTWQYYKPTNVNVSPINYHSKENDYTKGPKFETNIDYVRNVTKQQLDGQEIVNQLRWILVIDNETKKAVKLLPAGYSITYEINEKKTINSVVYTDHGPDRKTSTTNLTKPKSFTLGPVGEDIPDPTVKTSDTWIQDYLKKQGVEIPAGLPIPKVSNQETVKNIQPDILVKSGDGKTSFGGEGSRKIRKDLEYGYQEENLHYSWNMTLKEK